MLVRRKLAVALVVVGLCTPLPAQGAQAAARVQTRVERHHHCQEDCEGAGNGNSGGDYEGGKSGDNDQRGDHNCRNFCVYVPTPPPGQRPQGFIPPNPGKIPQQIADFIKVVSDFVQAVIKFAV